MVGVRYRVTQAAVGLGAHDLLGFIRDAPAHQRVWREARDAVNFTTRGQAQNAHVAGMSTTPQTIVGVEFAWFKVHIGTGLCSWCGGGGRCSGRGGCRLVVARCNAYRQTRYGRSIDEAASAHAGGFGAQVYFFIAHGDHLC